MTYNDILVTVLSSSIWASTYEYDSNVSTIVYTTVQTSTFNIKVADLYKIFVTEAIYWGNLGGVSGVDNKCAAQATKKGLSGTYKAIISLSDAAGGARRACSTSNCLNPDGTLNWTSSSKDWVLKDRVNYFRTDETFIASSNKAGIFMPENWINSIGTDNDKYSTDNITHYTLGASSYTKNWNTSLYSLNEKPYAVITAMGNDWIGHSEETDSGVDSNCTNYTVPTESSFTVELFDLGMAEPYSRYKARRTNANSKKLYTTNEVTDITGYKYYFSPYNCAAPIYSLYCAEQ